MSTILNFDKVDAAGIDVNTGEYILKIIDHLDWSDEYSHLMALQKKINAYFAFVESGEIYDSIKSSKKREIVISIDFRVSPSENCKKLIKHCKQIAKESLGITIRYKTLA
jgi:hypothetical protein